MHFTQVSRTSPEAFYTVVTNVEAVTITTGYAVGLCLAAGSAYGATATNNVVLADCDTALTIRGLLGVAESDIASNGVGRVITWGYAKSVYLSASLGDCAFTNGDALIPGKDPGGLFSLATEAALQTTGGSHVIALSVGVSARGYCSGFVRCF